MGKHWDSQNANEYPYGQTLEQSKYKRISIWATIGAVKIQANIHMSKHWDSQNASEYAYEQTCFDCKMLYKILMRIVFYEK